MNTPLYVVISHFEIANGMSDEVKDAFRNRPHRVEQASGFVRMDVLSPVDNPAQFQLITYWQNQASYENWHHSHAYKDSHQGMPQGLKLVNTSTSIRVFEHVTS